MTSEERREARYQRRRVRRQEKRAARCAAQMCIRDRSYTVVSGDCLWNIAKKYYGDGSQYTKIYEANKGTIGSNPNLIKPGQKLVIPLSLIHISGGRCEGAPAG